jgi:predicted amidohydrolase YtcJ
MNPVDQLIVNATIHTMNPEAPSASWMAVTRGEIVALGTGDDMPAARHTRDAEGLTIVPGFHDAHCHTVWFGLSLAELDCGAFSTLDALYDALAERAGTLPAGEWVLATGFNQELFDGHYPDIAKLDRALPNHPLFMRHTSGHACIVNTLALSLSGVTDASSGMDGGAVVTDSSGKPTGLLEERAQSLIQQLLLPKSVDDMVAAIDRASQRYAAEGLTGFTETGIAGGWIGHSPVEFAAYQKAREGGQLRQRAQIMPVSDVLGPVVGHRNDHPMNTLSAGIRTGLGDDFLSIGPTKIFLDGSMLAWTGAMSEPFAAGPPDNYGYFQAEPNILREAMLRAAGAGWSIAAHAIGDRAVTLALDTFDEAIARFGHPSIPHRIEHGGVVTNEQIAIAAKLHVAIVTQPGFMPALGLQMRQAMGPERENLIHRHKSLIDGGVMVGGSSDRPVATGVPLSIMQSMITREDSTGYVVGPAERVSAYEALWSYTVGSAQVTGTSHRRGSLEVGKVADWVMLGSDLLTYPLDQIASIPVVETAVAGKPIHQLG